MAKKGMVATAPGQLRALQFPTLEEHRTPGGLRVVAARRGPLPLVAMRLVVEAGSAVDPSDKLGLAELTVSLWRRGTATLSADQIDEAIEFVGGSLGLGASEDYLSIAMSAPAEHMEALMQVLGKLASEPSFVPLEVESARRRHLAMLANELDDPGAIAQRALLRAVWGDHPYGHEVSGMRAHVGRVTRDDVVAFQREHVGPRVSTLIVVGDVAAVDVFAAADRAFAGFSGGPASAKPPAPKSKAQLAGQVLLVDKPDQTQTQVRVGGLGVKKTDPDKFAIVAFNTVLGGGFTSRLVTEVRVKRGLSYGAGSSFDSLKAGGTFCASTFTKTETTRKAIDVVQRELSRMRKQGPTPEELRAAQRYVVGLYPARFETNESVSAAVADMVVHQIPLEWIARYRERVVAVSTREATAAAKAHLPEDPTLVLVGNAEKIRPQLSGLGPVTEIQAAELE
ncbi:MAG: M16 family metallopeptidase [Myxococcota bacterium]